MFDQQVAEASTDDGAWKLEDGEDYYNVRLKHYTTTSLTADEIHEIGLREVARIQDEMRAIMKRVEFDGTLKEFFDFLRTNSPIPTPMKAEVPIWRKPRRLLMRCVRS